MSAEVWILGGTGRTGRDTARVLAAGGLPVRLIGRDHRRLLDAADAMPGRVETLVAPDLETMAAAIRRDAPAVVVHTAGPFARTALPIAEACLPHSSYLDLANDFVAADVVHQLDARAREAGRTLVSGAGFGVLATEAPLVAALRDRPRPRAVRVDAVASLALVGGTMGDALASTIVEALPAGGRRVTGGRLVRAGIGSHGSRVELPDGGAVTTGAWPSGDLVVAARTSGAPDVIAATTEVPTGGVVRAIVPIVGPLLRIPPLERLAARRLSRMAFDDRPRPREHSWGRARVEWSDGSVREAWLRTGDAGEFTAAAAAAVARRIAAGDAEPGAHSPVSAVGIDVVEEAGGTLLTAW